MIFAFILLAISMVVWELEAILFDHNRRQWLRIGRSTFELLRILAFGVGGFSCIYIVSQCGY